MEKIELNPDDLIGTCPYCGSTRIGTRYTDFGIEFGCCICQIELNRSEIIFVPYSKELYDNRNKNVS